MKIERTLKSLLLVVILFFMSGCYFFEIEPTDISQGVYYNDYGSVWTAAIDALDEEGFVIAQMRRSDGYVSTDKRERGDSRVKLSLRFYNTEDGGILIKIKESREVNVGEGSSIYGGWQPITDTGFGLATFRLKKLMNRKFLGKFKIKE